jgi:hypothetical protein
MKFIRRWLFLPWYRYVYAPIADLVHNYQHRHDPEPPPMVCQLCGKPGHKERYCPYARELGYLDE